MKYLIVLLVAVLLFFQGLGFAVEIDPTEQQRINMKSFAKITGHTDLIIKSDDIMRSLRVYDGIDNNLETSKESKGLYVFADHPTMRQIDRKYFVVHAKASFPKGTFQSLKPNHAIQFLDIFFVTEINNRMMKIYKRQTKTEYSINVNDFQNAFLWYSDLLDKGRAYMPIYGFLSIPSDTVSTPDFYDGWTKNKNLVFRSSEGLKHFEFYKVLDQQGDFVLLAESRDVFEYRTNFEVTDYGILGWVNKKFVVLWRSRLYYHPKQQVSYFDSTDSIYQKTEQINQYYLAQAYPGRELIEQIIGHSIKTYDNFYANFGFPKVYEPCKRQDNYAEVFIMGILSTQIVKNLLVKKIKNNINCFFLIDTSQSMIPFKRFIKSFTDNINNMPKFGLNEYKIFRYMDSPMGNHFEFHDDYIDLPNIKFGLETKDNDYNEPLMNAIGRSLESIKGEIDEGHINPRQYKFLFVITDAGPNDNETELHKSVLRLANQKKMDIFVIFIIPDKSGAKMYPNMMDTPDRAYLDLIKIIDQLGDELNRCYVYTFPTGMLQYSQKRDDKFNETSINILKKIESTLSLNIDKNESVNQKGFLSFMLASTLNEINTWSDTNINIASHVIKLIKNPQDPTIWEQRVAIPAKIVQTYVNADEDSMVTLKDLKKIFIVNSMMSSYDIESCRKIYKHIDKVLSENRRTNLDRLFYHALTGRSAHPKTKWVKSLSKEKLREYLKKRRFYLNSVEKKTEQKYIYLKEREFFIGDDQ